MFKYSIYYDIFLINVFTFALFFINLLIVEKKKNSDNLEVNSKINKF
jgi:hypothetical protein